MKRAAVVAIGVLVLGTTACLASVHTVPLHYPPLVSDPHAGSAAAADETEARSLPTVGVGAFVDRRSWSRIGEARSSWGFHYASIEAAGALDEWTREAIVFELERLRVDAALVESDAARGFDLLIEGRVRDAFVSRRFYLEPRLKLTAFVRCTCHRRILQRLVFEESASYDRDAEGRHAEALSRVLERAARGIAAAASRCEPCDA